MSGMFFETQCTYIHAGNNKKKKKINKHRIIITIRIIIIPTIITI